jgi:hypothetical protein
MELMDIDLPSCSYSSLTKHCDWCGIKSDDVIAFKRMPCYPYVNFCNTNVECFNNYNLWIFGLIEECPFSESKRTNLLTCNYCRRTCSLVVDIGESSKYYNNARAFCHISVRACQDNYTKFLVIKGILTDLYPKRPIFVKPD